MLTTLFVTLFFGISSYASEVSPWTITAKLERIENKKKNSTIIRSIIEFRNGQRAYSYRPEHPGYYFNSHLIENLDKQDFAVTIWANGARTAMFRVFQLSNTAEPKLICEKISYSDNTELRWNNTSLEIKLLDEPNSPAKWIPCTK